MIYSDLDTVWLKEAVSPLATAASVNNADVIGMSELLDPSKCISL
jgi:hypothetical protein